MNELPENLQRAKEHYTRIWVYFHAMHPEVTVEEFDELLIRTFERQLKEREENHEND